MISCCGGASEVVSARIGSAWQKFRELSGFISVVLDQFCCIFVKSGKLLLWMRRCCVGWSVV